MTNVRSVRVGDITIGNAPISIQSMTNTDTRDEAATVAQILRLENAGCDIARFSVYDKACALAIPGIKAKTHIPLVADIHFDYTLAIAAMENGINKLRFNPGNIGSDENVKRLVDCAKAHHTPIRIGVNSGSIEKDIQNELGATPNALVKSAMRHVVLLEKLGFYDIVVSVKSSDVCSTVQAYRKLSQLTDHPLHIGVTETGLDEAGLVKSAIGIGSLLLDGIGSTMRVSLTGDPVKEVAAAKYILEALGIRRGIEIISCPTCGRTTGNLENAVRKLKNALEGKKGTLKIAVMGCVVNGPGEAKEADIGIAFAPGGAVVFKHGERAYQGQMPEIFDTFIKDVRDTLNASTI